MLSLATSCYLLQLQGYEGGAARAHVDSPMGKACQKNEGKLRRAELRNGMKEKKSLLTPFEPFDLFETGISPILAIFMNPQISLLLV